MVGLLRFPRSSRSRYVLASTPVSLLLRWPATTEISGRASCGFAPPAEGESARDLDCSSVGPRIRCRYTRGMAYGLLGTGGKLRSH